MADQGAVQIQRHHYKVLLLGDSGVGKSSFFLRIRDGLFDNEKFDPSTFGDYVLDYHMKIDDCDVLVRSINNDYVIL